MNDTYGVSLKQKVNIYVETDFNGVKTQYGKYIALIELVTKTGMKATKEVYGQGANVTRNEMILHAVVHALKQLVKGDCDIAIFTDSTYINGATNAGYLEKWRMNNWITAKGKKVSNLDSWKEIYKYTLSNHIAFYQKSIHEYREKMLHDLQVITNV